MPSLGRALFSSSFTEEARRTVWSVNENVIEPGDPADSWSALVATLFETYPFSHGSVMFREGHVRCTHIAHGWLMRCIRNTRACLLLRDAGLSVEAAPLRRSTLEHATALAWLEDEGDAAVETIWRGNVNYAEQQWDSVVGAGWSLPDEAFREVIEDRPTDENRHLDQDLHFWQRNARYGSPDNLPVYRVESSHTHPSWTSAAPYCRETNDAAAVTLLAEPREAPLDEDAAGYVLLAPALVAFNQMLATHDMTDALRQILARGRELQARGLAAQGKPRPPEFDDPILPDLP